jgi:hypothetical protein
MTGGVHQSAVQKGERVSWEPMDNRLTVVIAPGFDSFANCDYFLYCVDEDCYRSDVQPKRALGAQDSPWRIRSSDHEVGTWASVDNVGMSAPPPATGVRTQDSVGVVGATSSPPIIDMDPINSVPSTSTQAQLRIQY